MGREKGSKFWEISVLCSKCQCNSALPFSTHHSHLKPLFRGSAVFIKCPDSIITLCKLALNRLAVVQMPAEALAQIQNVSFFFSLFSARHNSAAFRLACFLLSKRKGVMNVFRREIMMLWHKLNMVFLSGWFQPQLVLLGCLIWMINDGQPHPVCSQPQGLLKWTQNDSSDLRR